MLLLVLLLITIAGGLGLLVGGARPREILHFVYAIVVFGAVPIAAALSAARLAADPGPGRTRGGDRRADRRRAPVRDGLASVDGYRRPVR